MPIVKPYSLSVTPRVIEDMDEDRIAVINVAIEAKVINVSYGSGWTAEDLCIKICQQLGISPVARHLFGLRDKNSKNWYHGAHKIESRDRQKYEFRCRFKPSTTTRLRKLDINAYDYYFHQVRADVLENKVPDIIFEKHKRELIGLGVADMYRVTIEKELSREAVESDYKKYIPRECIKKHSFFIKKPIRNALAGLSGHDAAFVREQYLKMFESMAPNYLCEEFKAIMDKGQGESASRVMLRVHPMKIEYYPMDENCHERQLVCAIEDLCFVSIRQDNTIEVSRKNGIPFYLKFHSHSVLMSFVSAIDGYYRLSMKWTFSLCVNAVTPSLDRLYKMRCHGPVGGEFSYAKLEEKRANRPGTFILRESETKYDTYYLDVCGRDSKPRTRKIEKIGTDDYALSESLQRFRSINQLINAHRDPDGLLYLNECLPPSEYDKPPLLICAPEIKKSDTVADEEIIAGVLDARTCIVPPYELQIYKAQPFPKSKESELKISNSGSMPKTVVYRAMWRVSKGKRLETAIKLLQEDEGQQTKEFLKLVSKWGQSKSTALVRLYGVTLAPTLGMLLELVKLGPLDVYLRSNTSQKVKVVDLVEAAACLANAVWYLGENNIVHGNIRCRKLLVHEHTESSFKVKLADPGLFTYKPSDVHWLPPECYGNPDLARRSIQADVWAIGTTIWEIFSKGSFSPEVGNIDTIRKFYASGKRLPIPVGCPPEIYKIMTECWGIAGESRKEPHAIMRDINKINYQVYNSRRTHAYATPMQKKSDLDNGHDDYSERATDNSISDCTSRASSLFTSQTTLPWDEFDDFEGVGKIDCTDMSQDTLSSYLGWLKTSSSDISGNGFDNDGGLLGQMQSIFELDADCNVILQGRIGQGFYGEVYLGTLEKGAGKDMEPQQVAVKKLKIRAVEADIRDFEREIDIMKTLKHPNIVEILGVISEPEVCLIMEFVKHGSLQSYLAIHRESLTHKRLLGFALDISTGMDYLGRKNIVHRDLAARNILVTEDNRVKISDFGLAQVTGQNDYYILQTNRNLPIKWYAPESLRDGKFSSRSDVWSFGVTMYETFSFGEDPKLSEMSWNAASNFAGTGSNEIQEEENGVDLLEALERGARLPCPPTCPQEVYVKIMYPCWNINSHERPDFIKLCKIIRELISEY